MGAGIQRLSFYWSVRQTNGFSIEVSNEEEKKEKKTRTADKENGNVDIVPGIPPLSGVSGHPSLPSTGLNPFSCSQHDPVPFVNAYMHAGHWGLG